MDALKNPEVIEIMLNPDGMLWIERYGQDQEPIGTMEPVRSRAVLSLVASALDLTVNDHSPIIEGEFPLDGSRFEATFPPIVSAPSFSLRKKASKVMSVEDYVADGVITPAVVPFLEHAVVTRKNIMVVGGTSSGKTTFVNAIIQRIALLCPSHRLLILEDTAELQSQSPNTVFFRTSPLAGVDMRTLAKVAMRYAPRRILIGEVRDSAALELLKLWNTGHPGGVGTFHADSAEEALPRLEELVEEAGLGSKQKLIGRGVDVIVFMEKRRIIAAVFPRSSKCMDSILKRNSTKRATSILFPPHERAMDTTKSNTDIRCGNCHRLLARGDVQAGVIELVCPRCKTRLILRASRPNLAPQDGLYGDRHARTSEALLEQH
ncbi:MAG: P-type conjugative transfer ATPase TrbB [Bilophila wadsworthia]